MKAVCKTCGRKFDPEKTDFLCPKCGAWYVTGNHYDIENEFKQGTIYDCDDCVDSHSGNEDGSFLKEEMRREAEERRQKKEKHEQNMSGDTGYTGDNGYAGGAGSGSTSGNAGMPPNINIDIKKARKIAMILPVAVFLMFAVLTIIGIFVSNDHNDYRDYDYDDYYYDDDDTGDDETTEYYFYKSSVELNQDGKGYSSTSYSYGDTISGINGCQDGTLTVSEPVDVSGDEGVTVPEGYEMYKIHYNFNKAEEDGSCSYDDVDYGYGTDVRGGGPVMYVHTKSGDYIGAAEHMEQYILFDDAESYSAKLTDGELKSGIFSGEGNLFFLVEDGNFDHVAVCDMIGLFDSENQQENRIYLIGEPGQEMSWTEIPDSADNAERKVYGIYSYPFMQRVSPDKETDLPINSHFDLNGYLEDNYMSNIYNVDWYVVGINIINYSTEYMEEPDFKAAYGEGYTAYLDELSYYSRKYIPPMTMVTRYYLVHVPQLETELSITFRNPEADDMQSAPEEQQSITLD